MIEWGGEVNNADYKQGSTTTEMGSGHFADEGPRKAANFDNIYTVDANNKSHDPTRLEVVVEKPKCYNLLAGASSFYYEGPGKSAACPWQTRFRYHIAEISPCIKLVMKEEKVCSVAI